MFIDRAVIEVRSGKGGDGAIAFRREKYVPKGGPAGGNGGRGASIILKANSKINTLFNFRHSKCFIGEDGEKGGIKNQYGKNSQDVIIEVPVGTMVFEEKEHRFLGDLSTDGLTLKVAKGGRGNTCFKSSTNRVPRIAENGEPGETKRLILELKLLADVGLVGFPSVGKSTLLSVVSSAKPEIADYPFTTIIPNLGVVRVKDGRSFVLADLPGIIEGAHQGKGLGLQFLRHIERCRIIVHVIDMSESGRDPVNDYKIIQKELKEYGFGLDKRPVIVVASKMDEEGVEELLYRCADLLDKTPAFPLFDKDEEELENKVYTLPEEEKEFEIKHPTNNTWIITGDKIIKFYKMTNISTDDGMMKLLTHLRKLKVDDKLEELGAQDGDQVILDDFTFEYYK